MPIVARIGGNSGNQTITMLVRAIALGQINPANARKLVMKGIVISVLNGLVWGGSIGLFAMLLYRSLSLGLVMTAAMTLNLLLAALFGVFIRLLMMQLGRDPAVGSNVLITAITDSGGFFIFLGLPLWSCCAEPSAWGARSDPQPALHPTSGEPRRICVS
jgi:magnesium transporter